MFESFWKFSVKFCDTFLESETDYKVGLNNRLIWLNAFPHTE